MEVNMSWGMLLVYGMTIESKKVNLNRSVP